MKNTITRALSLLLSLTLLAVLLPAARAAEDANAFSSVADIEVTPSAKDGHLRFGEAGDVSSISADGVSLSRSISLSEAMQEVCARTSDSLPGTARLEYVAYVAVSATQGTLYDGYSTEGDTGAGVAGVGRYYFDEANGSTYRVQDIRFVPKTNFSGRAMVSYYGYYVYTTADGSARGSYSGRIYITVGKQQPGISYASDGEPARFSAEDFASYSLAVTGRTFRYVTFTPPGSSKGKLYYNYLSNSIYDNEIVSGERYYRSSNPSVDNVYFVPKDGYSGTFLLPFSGVDSAGTRLTGNITLTVTSYGPEHASKSDDDLTYELQPGASVYLTKTEGFTNMCRDKLGYDYEFSHIRIMSLPSTREGRLYRGSGTGDEVSGNTNYYLESGGSNRISNIRFQSRYDFEGTVTVPFRGYADYRGSGSSDTRYFNGNLKFIVSRDSSGDAPLHYTVDPGKTVFFEANDFIAIAETEMPDSYLNRITIDSLPPTSAGTLYYLDGDNVIRVRTNKDYYRGFLGDLHFIASDSFTGSVSIPFTGRDSTSSSNSSSRRHVFSGTIIIESSRSGRETSAVESPTGSTEGALTYYTTQYPVRIRMEDVASRASSALPGAPVTFTLTRPDTAAGSLCMDFLSLTSFSAYDPRQTYPIADLSRVYFLPKSGFSGTTRVSCTVKDAKGSSYMGSIDFTVIPPTVSNYFEDLNLHAWAVPAVDFFRTYGVTNGVSPKRFAPNDPMRRGDFVLLLSRACSFPAVVDAEPFEDVPGSAYYASAVTAARGLGIVTGSSEGAFNPDGTITREEAATYLYRALRRFRDVQPGSADNIAAYPDASSVSPAAVEAMGALVRLGIIDGVSGRLLPERALTRAETITMLYRAFT